VATQIHTWLLEVEKILLGTSATNTRFTASPFKQSPAPFDFKEVHDTHDHRAFRVEVTESEDAGGGSSKHVKELANLQVWVLWDWREADDDEPTAYRELWQELDRIEQAIIADRPANSVFGSVIFTRAGERVERADPTRYVGLVEIGADFSKDLGNVA